MAGSTGGSRRAAGSSKAAPARATAAKRTTTARTAPAKAAAKRTAPPKEPTAASPVEPAASAAPARPPLTAEPVGGQSGRSLPFQVSAIVLVLAALVLLLRMANQEWRDGPAHGDISIGDGIPATLYLPQDQSDDGDLPDQLPEGERPPVVVMVHGYSADRASMSGLARSLAEAGYGVVSFDFRGHGSNTHRFQGDLRDDVDAVVDWAETSPWFDGDRLAVLGHSMGAGAVLDFASLDDRPDAVVPVSGGWQLNDAVTPKHTLFLVADGDPDRIAESQEVLAAQLKDKGPEVDVHSVEITGSDHIRILRDSDTVGEITKFLDPILGIDRPDGETPGIVDPRYKTALLYLIVVLGLLVLLGSVVGALAGRREGRGTSTAPLWSGFALVGGALVLAMPPMAKGGYDLLPLGAGQMIVMHVALASGILWGARALARSGQMGGRAAAWLGDEPWWPTRADVVRGLAASGVAIALLLPMQGVFHRLMPTPQRAVYWVVMSIVALPFFAATEALTRRGKGGIATAMGVLGKVLLLVTLFVGLGVGVLPGVIALVLPLLVLQYVALELFAFACFANGRNTAVIAVVDAVIIGWLAVTLTPVG